MNVNHFRNSLLNGLTPLYGEPEAAAIYRCVVDYLSRNTIIPANANEDWPDETSRLAESIRNSLLQGIPLQYVLQESWFDGRPFYVDDSVLIPRPETEELLDWIRKEESSRSHPIRILEIGTGSAILSISLKRAFPQSQITAIDISEKALAVAEKNAQRFGESIELLKMDFIDKINWEKLSEYDLIVSNPPYIPLSEKATLPDWVTLHEPSIALFVGDEDPLIFYRLMISFAEDHLGAGGRIYAELHEDMAGRVRELFRQMGLETQVKRDMQNKDRMICAWK